MAGMQHFVLFDEIDKAHTRKSGDSRAAFGNRMLLAVPLWKVIVGPRADKLQTGPARVRFSFRERGCPSSAKREWWAAPHVGRYGIARERPDGLRGPTQITGILCMIRDFLATAARNRGFCNRA